VHAADGACRARFPEKGIGRQNDEYEWPVGESNDLCEYARD
jgi:hypothetical protein